jgi:hypothetical protein
MMAILEVVIAGIGIGSNSHHRGAPSRRPRARSSTQGGRKRAKRRNIDACRCAEAHRSFFRAGIDLIGNSPWTVEHQAGDTSRSPGAQLDLRQVATSTGLAAGLARWRHRSGITPAKLVSAMSTHGAVPIWLTCRLDRLAQGEAQGLAIGIGAAASTECAAGGSDGAGPGWSWLLKVMASTPPGGRR